MLKTCPSTYVKTGMGILLLASQEIVKVGKFSSISEQLTRLSRINASSFSDSKEEYMMLQRK